MFKLGVFDLINKVKWGVWNVFGSLFKEIVRQNYVDLVFSLSFLLEFFSQVEFGIDRKLIGYEILMVIFEDGIIKIMLNWFIKKNVLNVEMYYEIMYVFKVVSKDDLVIIVLIGNGDYYSSGNDLINFIDIFFGGVEEKVKNGVILLREFVGCFIDFFKFLIVVVNGLVVGIFVIFFGLFDVVYVFDRVIFYILFSYFG